MDLATAQDGRIRGRIAYGWIRKGPTRAKPSPQKRSLSPRSATTSSAGESAYSLAKKLNDSKVMPPAAARWSATMVREMLRNPRHAGMVSYGGRHRVDPVPRQVTGRFSGSGKLGTRGSAAPVWTSWGRFQASASWGRTVLYSSR